jgi:thiol-disulfide isomerase/thioredoxin
MTIYLAHVGSAISLENITIPTASGDEIIAEHFPAKGDYLLLWFAPEYGLREAHRSLAGNLGKHNIEVWLCNLLESLFLPNGTRSIRQLDGKYVAEMINYAHKITGKKIIVAGDSYASVIALNGAHRWQEQRSTETYLIGAILFSPYTYAYVPPLGQPPEYLPIVSATNIPIMIYQAQNSAIIGQFDTLTKKLQQHGSPIYHQFMPGIMSLFYQSEPTPAMRQQAKPLPTSIAKMVNLLDKHPFPKKTIPLHSQKNDSSGIDINLKVYNGKIKPIPIRLTDTQGHSFVKNDYKGKVTIINFWATWCPPCIEEIPSLNRLKNKMNGLPIELLSINYAEDQTTILEFMKKVHVHFPVLLDPHGDFARQWNVISYPSTFVIDSEGKIRYGINAAIEWDTPEVIAKLKTLI